VTLSEFQQSWIFRTMARVLVAALIVASVPIPATAAPQAQEPRDAPPPTPKVKVNRTLPSVTSPPSIARFSEQPTNEEIFRAKVFEEPLVADGTTSGQENQALATAIATYLRGKNPEDVTLFEGFLREHPSSSWRASLLTDLGTVYRRTGYFSRALAAWQEAWNLSRNATEARPRAVADVALSHLATLYARLGRAEDLAPLLEEAKSRNVSGSASERLNEAKQSLWLMRNRPQKSFRCGPLALGRLVALARNDQRPEPKVAAYPSTTKGTSLLQMRDLGRTVGLKVKIAKRTADADPLVPAIVHWKTGHFAALVQQEGSRYLSQDPTFGDEIWVSRAALDDESTGYFLVMDRPLPKGWQDVADAEGATVWGKGAPPNPNPKNQTPCEDNTDGNGNGCPSCSGSSGTKGPGGSQFNCKMPCGAPNNGPSSPGGMPTYTIQTMMLNLHITDSPVAYAPPIGPNVAFVMTYNAKDVFQPQLFTYSNLGPKWTFNWLSYVQDDPSKPDANVDVYLRGGGVETSTAYNASTGSFAPHYRSSAVIVRTSSSPIRYERQLSDGSKEIYSQPDAAGAFPRKVFLTSFADPMGNTVQLTYDQDFRLVALSDAIQQVTTLSYNDPSDPFRITSVTDPFGRSASFQYNWAGELSQITDVIGLTSQFAYEPGDFISELTTPYGTTHFSQGFVYPDGGDLPWIQATDPLGGTEKLFYNFDDLLPGTSLTDAQVPTGFEAYNNALNIQSTYYWDKRAMALYPGDYSKAKVIHWLMEASTGQVSGVKHSEKLPLESRVWYMYPNQFGINSTGSLASPIKVARVLDDGSSQIYQYEYNRQTKPTRVIDPLGRETVYSYGTGNTIDADQATGMGIDLLQVKQKNPEAPGGYDVLETLTYNAQHQPTTVIDAAGQATTYTYEPTGQVATKTTPPRAGITENRTTTYTYDLASHQLKTITRPAAGATTSFTYDGYGRPRTLTDSQGYTVTVDYDALDRQTRITHPDGTYEEIVYNRLDAEKRRDRLGRWSEVFYDALRRVVATRDAAGRTTTLVWCLCGSLDSVTDSNGNSRRWERDVQGRVLRDVRPDGSDTEFVYETTTSRLKLERDAKAQETRYSYFLDDRLAEIGYANTQVPTPTVSFGYGSIYPRRESMTDGTGTTRYSYHPVTVPPALGAGRLASADGPLANDTITYEYDERGRVASRTLEGATDTWHYDSLGRTDTITDPIGAFGVTYLGATRKLAGLSYPNSQTTSYYYAPLPRDPRLQEIHHRKADGTTLARLTYDHDAAGNVTTWTQQFESADATAYDLTYDAANELTDATYHTVGPAPVLLKRYAYGYDTAANRTIEQVDGTATLASYDATNHLISQQPGGALRFEGTVNEPAKVTIQGRAADVDAQNRFRGSAQVSGGTTMVDVIAVDATTNSRVNTYRVTVPGSSATYSYDANGNLVGDGANTYDWDGANRLVRVLRGGVEVARFAYDGLGRRVQKTTTGGVTHQYVYDSDDILEERLSNGPTRRYVHGPTRVDQPLARIESGAPTYYVADHLGSILVETDGSSTTALRRQYDPWGNLQQGADVSGYAFTGREWDAETGLYYYRARYYSAKLGRFLSEDPLANIAQNMSPDPASLESTVQRRFSAYTYADNAPTVFSDPFGLKACSECSKELMETLEGIQEDVEEQVYAAVIGYTLCALMAEQSLPAQMGCAAALMVTLLIIGRLARNQQERAFRAYDSCIKDCDKEPPVPLKPCPKCCALPRT
jgi:RHS repeat-associated protein